MKTEGRDSRERGKKGMKGQFFLLAAFFMLLAFYLGVSAYLSPSFARPAIKDEISGLFENVENEYPMAFNLGLNSSGPAAALANFSGIAVAVAGEKGADLGILWIFTESSGGDLNVTAGNFMGHSLNVTLNVSGEVRQIQLGESGTDSEIFAPPSSEFELRLNFNTTEKNLLLEKYKANLYAFMEMRKGSDVIRGETKA